MILNELGDSTAIESKSLTITHSGTESIEWLELGNGCICCSVRDAGVVAIEDLLTRQTSSGDGSPGIEYILLETSGLADPGRLVGTFWVDGGLESGLFLDGVVCVVDAWNLERTLATVPEGVELVEGGMVSEGSGEGLMTTAHLQISHADVVVLNKIDKFSDPKDVQRVIERVRGINGLARIEVTSFGKVAELKGTVLELHAYDDVDIASLDHHQGHHQSHGNGNGNEHGDGKDEKSHLDPVSPPHPNHKSVLSKLLI